jgi:hypothetical protein
MFGSFSRVLFARKPRTIVGRQPNSRKLAVEILEDRLTPATFTVVSVSDTDDGMAANLGTLSLRKAVRLANADPVADTINFKLPAGSTITFGSEITITNPVSINGPGANLLTLDGNNTTRLFTIDDNTSTSIAVGLSGLKLTRGNSISGDGGAIRNQETLTVTNSTLSGNSAGSGGGGGIFNSGGTLTVTNSTLSGNSAGTGGGGINNSGGTLTVTTLVRQSWAGHCHPRSKKSTT